MSKSDFNKVKIGDFFSRHSFGKVVGRDSHSLTIENDKGFGWTISKDIVEKEFNFADHVDDEKLLTRTEIIEIFKGAKQTVMTVCFNKQAKIPEVRKQLHNLYPNKGKIISESEFKKEVNDAIKNVLSGEERIMVGYHYGKTDDTGRIMFTDMEASDGRPRRVDTRTINWLIVEGTRYNVKK